jgi:predicted RNase H-like HicB family nuclease
MGKESTNLTRGPIMEIAVLIEPVAGNGYRARGVESFGLSAEGATREEVLAKLRQQLQERLQDGAQMLSLDVPKPHAGNPWTEFAGMFKDDPYFDEWQRAIAENRRKIDADPDIP